MDVLFVFRAIILEFIAELYVFYALTTKRLSRRADYWLRLAAGFLGVLIISLGLSFIYKYIGGTAPGRIVIYLIIFAASTANIYFACEENYTSVLLCCSVAYAAQNLVYKLFLTLWTWGEAFRLYDSWGAAFDVIYHVVYYVFFALAAIAAYKLFLKRIVKNVAVIDNNMLALALMALVLTVVICSVEDVAFSHLSIVRENRFDSGDLVVLRETGNILSIIACGSVLVLASMTLRHKELKQEVEYLQHAIKQSEMQYEISKDTIGLINIKCHDMKYKLAALLKNDGVRAPELIEDINKTISIYDSQVETGNKLVDVILTEKSLYCEQNCISFSCMADGEKLNFIEDGDLYCLLGNIIDNALEAVRAIEDRDKRVVNLVVRSRGDMLTIEEENFFSGVIEWKDGAAVTTKENKDYHGFGLRSIELIASKYGGSLTTWASGDVFHLSIVFGAAKAE